MMIITDMSFAQQNNFNKEFELKKFIEHGGKVLETSPNNYKLTYSTGESRTFFLNSKLDINSYYEPIDTIIINVWEIDTTLYAKKFSFWQKVNIANQRSYPTFVHDLNFNGKPELYGFSDRYSYPAPPQMGPVEIYELNDDGIFDSVYAFDSTTIFIIGIGNVRENGRKEIFIRSRTTLNGDFYKSDTTGILPTNYDFTFYYEPNQINNMTFGDFDNNGISDCAFVDGSNPSKIIFSEFRDTINNFVTNYEQVTEGDVPAGFAIADFDQDGKTELALGTLQRNIYVIENMNINSYEIVWQGISSVFNSYMVTATNDIDGNGKREFWIGGQDFVNGITRFQCYEAKGDNTYEQVAMIELRYINSFDANYIQAADMDNDGFEELMISIGQLVLILKFDGLPNQHSYKIYYAKIGEQSQPGCTFYQANIYDLDGDNKKDIILPMDIYVNPHLVTFSYLLRQDYSTDIISDVNNVTTYNLEQNFPNPFNLLTKINFTVPKATYVRIKVFDILGKEIKTLLDEEISAGEYSISWNGADHNGNILNSGVYFITMKTISFHKTIKTILLK